MAFMGGLHNSRHPEQETSVLDVGLMSEKFSYRCTHSTVVEATRVITGYAQKTTGVCSVKWRLLTGHYSLSFSVLLN